MTKQLYEEALADVRKVKEIAEANAQRAVLEAVTPRIRDLIEKELLRESNDDLLEEDLAAPGSVPPEGELMTDEVPVASSVLNDIEASHQAITPPDEEGKVTLDLDALDDEGVSFEDISPNVENLPIDQLANDEEFEISLESANSLKPIIGLANGARALRFDSNIKKLENSISIIGNILSLYEGTSALDDKIAKTINEIENMYDYVQKSISDKNKKSLYESKLETYFKKINKIQENNEMSKKTNKLLNEEDVTLKLTGLPDDIDLDSVGVDLITGAEDEESEDAEELDSNEEESGESEDSEELDLGSEDSEESDEEMGESLNLSDNTIVEIDEGMLKKEIARMRKLRESEHKAAILSDFGDASSEGEPLEFDLSESEDQMDESQDEMEEAWGEAEEMDELDQAAACYEEEMDQVGDRRTRDDLGGSATSVPSKDKSNPAHKVETLERKIALESRLQERFKMRAAYLKNEVAKSSKTKSTSIVAALKKEYAANANRYNESVKRSNNFKKLMVETKMLHNKTRQNGSLSRSAESQTEVASLRSKLAETNLINAKLLFTNKLLQNETLSAKQKANVIEQLDAAKTVREAKLVYESLAKTLVSATRTVNENKEHKVLGSSSRATKPASTQSLNEGYEAERWARLAGITK